jgi:hypothetical protein
MGSGFVFVMGVGVGEVEGGGMMRPRRGQRVVGGQLAKEERARCLARRDCLPPLLVLLHEIWGRWIYLLCCRLFFRQHHEPLGCRHSPSDMLLVSVERLPIRLVLFRGTCGRAGRWRLQLR